MASPPLTVSMQFWDLYWVALTVQLDPPRHPLPRSSTREGFRAEIIHPGPLPDFVTVTVFAQELRSGENSTHLHELPLQRATKTETKGATR
jgi:hypothetical protein